MSNAVTNVTPIREIDLTPTQVALIKRTLAADTNDDEFNLFIEVARRMKADPFRRHLYALVYNKDDPKKRRMSIVTGIDFYRTVAARNRDYRPDDQEATITYDENAKCDENPLGIVKAVVRAYKLAPSGDWWPVVGEAYWQEYVPTDEEGDEGFEWVETGEVWKDTGRPKKKKVPLGTVRRKPKGKWASMPRVMITKCAEAVALRRGWPEDLSGVYVQEEMDKAVAEDLSATELAEQADAEKRLKLSGAKDAIMILWHPGDALDAVPIGQFADKAMAFLKAATNASDVKAWQETNRAPLREFWAKQKSDGLELAKAAEARIKELAA